MATPSGHKAPHLKSFESQDFLDALRRAGEGHSAALEDLPKIIKNANLEENHDLLTGYSKLLNVISKNYESKIPRHLSSWVACGTFPSPFKTNPARYNLGMSFVDPNETVLVDIVTHATRQTISREFMRAGPREFIAFHPKTVKAAIVTCGGLCPGLNTVIRELFMSLRSLYGVKDIYGIPFGYRGFYSPNMEVKKLEVEDVVNIQHQGGTMLGSSRGGHDTKLIVDAIQDYGFTQVYIIGGDGTHRGAIKLADEVERRGLKIAVVGIPKTIDNDIALIDKSFGFDTAVEEAQRAIKSAKVEAVSGINGIGLVKLMGRHSGYIAMYACMASREVDACLIPEVPFELNGPKGLLQYIKSLFNEKGHAVIVIAEGAGMDLLAEEVDKSKTDESGNVKLPDVGLWLKDKINNHMKENNIECNLKYIDPTYMIRTVPANAGDSLYCGLLAQSAVHGAMAGYTSFTVGLINTHYVLIPMSEICDRGRISVDTTSRMWHRVVATTGQPHMKASPEN